MTSDLYIEWMGWKKKSVEKGSRKFAFGAKTESERDEWITSIEYLRTKNIYDNFAKNYANITFPIEIPIPKSWNKKLMSATMIEDQPSFGLMIRKQVELIGHNPDLIKKLSSARKQSVVQNLLDKKRASSYSVDSFHSFNNNENTIKEAAEKIKILYNISISYFIGQLTENWIKTNTIKHNNIGKVPEWMKLINFVKGMRVSSPSLSKKNENAKRGTGSSSGKLNNKFS